MKIRKHIVFWGDIEGGRLKLHSEERFKKYIGTLKGLVSIEVRQRKKKRTTPQNSLYWLWITVIADYCGYEPIEMHDTFKSLFNNEIKHVANKQTGEIKMVRVTRSTTILGIAEFCDYMDSIERYAADLGITLPSPEEFYKS